MLLASHGGLGRSPPPLPLLRLNDGVGPRRSPSRPEGSRCFYGFPPHGVGAQRTFPLGNGCWGLTFSSHLLLPAAQQAGLSQAQGETGIQKEGGQLRLHSPCASQRSGGRVCTRVCVCLGMCYNGVAGLGWGERRTRGPREHTCAGGGCLQPELCSWRCSSPCKAAERDPVSPSAQWERGRPFWVCGPESTL